MTNRVVVLGGGTGGTLVANRLRRRLRREDAEIVVVDADDRHLYQPGLLFVPFGLARTEDLVRSRRAQLHAGVDFVEGAIESVDLGEREVRIARSEPIRYDVLVVASGAVLQPEETDGLTGPGWGEHVLTFYEPRGAAALAAALDRFAGGRVVVDVVDMPIKCPVAPLEFAFLADWYFRRRAMRDAVELVLVTPLDGAFTKPVCDRELSGLLRAKGVEVVSEFSTGAVDGRGRRIVSYDGREVPFDLAVVVPLHGGAPYVARSPGLGDELGFVDVDEHTLQSPRYPEVFAIGDAAGIPTSKAGSVAHFAGEVLVENVLAVLRGNAPIARFDGHTNCFIESGFKKALLIDFNYETEPLPGHFPGPVGLPLLHESRLNHLGKRAFEWVYWNALLPGRDLPGVGSRMPVRGKARVPAGSRVGV
ncbi:MAG: FAD/NAD(P)-binding oxidoreductase [Actinomycetota bacterium]|nr:FAD/NAD(P)-binding oxidoreductase [Actinomycetota bacterium]